MNHNYSSGSRIRNVLRLSLCMKPYGLRVVGAILSGIMNQLSMVGLAVAGALIVSWAIDGSLLSKSRIAITISVLAMVLRLVFYVAEMWICHDVAFKVLADFRIRLFASIERVSPSILLNMRSGQLASTLMGDVELLEWFFAHTFGSMIVAVIAPSILLAILGFILPILVPVLLVFVVFAVWIPLALKKKADAQGMEVRDNLGVANAVTIEGVQGMKEILTLNYRDAYSKKHSNYMDRFYDSQIRYSKRLGTEGALLQLVAGLSGILSAVIAALYTNSAGNGTMAPAMYTVIVVLAGSILGPIIEVCNTARNLGLILGAADRVYRVIEAVPTVEDSGEDLDVTELSPEISFDHVSFRYGESLPLALTDVSFQVKPGETVALIGASGAGKSTCLSLLLRYWDPEKGCVSIGGKSLKDMSIASLNQMVSTVLQDVYLFRISIRDNIRLGRLDATDEEIEEAAKQALAHEFIMELPKGYDTIAGEAGTKLSGGQRQRIAIARAFLKDAPILILDEAVSNLDTENEWKIRESIRNGSKNRTTLIVAHRPSTIRLADRVVELKKGVVSGT